MRIDASVEIPEYSHVNSKPRRRATVFRKHASDEKTGDELTE